MAKKSLEKISKRAVGLIDKRQCDDAQVMIERDRNVKMIDIFGGDEQKTAVAYFVSKMMVKGYDNDKIIKAVESEFNLQWSVRRLNVVKTLIHKIWRCEMAHTMEDHIAREVASIDVQVQEAWEAWEKSKHAKKTRTRSEKSTGFAQAGTEYDLTESEVNENDDAGDPKYMTIIIELGKEKRKLLGLYAPEKKEESGGNNIQMNFVGDAAGAKSADLMQMIMGMSAAQIKQAEKPKVEEAQAVTIESTPKANNEEINIDELMEDFWE